MPAFVEIGDKAINLDRVSFVLVSDKDASALTSQGIHCRVHFSGGATDLELQGDQARQFLEAASLHLQPAPRK